MKIGFGSYDVTPPLGIGMMGYSGRKGTAEGVHDQLYARAMVAEAGKTGAAVIVADVCMVPKWMCDATAELVHDRTGIPARNVIVAGTHTHSGPNTFRRGTRSELKRHYPSIWKRTRRFNTFKGDLYNELLPELMASAAGLAWTNRRNASLSAATSKTKDLTVNRRKIDGPRNEEVGLVVASDTRGKPFGLVFDYACHGVVMGPPNLLLSGDFISLARKYVEETIPGIVSLLAVAPSADINPMPDDVLKAIRSKGKKYFTNDPFKGVYNRSPGTFEQTEKMAKALGRAVVKAFKKRRRIRSTVLRCTSASINIGKKKRVMVPIRVIRMGEAVFVSLPGEQFVETGTAARKLIRDRGRQPVVISHAESLCYVPTEKAYEQGGYEVRSAEKNGLAKDAVKRELRTITRLLKKV